jgi:hypothetical protein
MDFGRLLAMKKNTVMTYHILLSKHAEEQRILIVIIESTDTVRLFRK